VSALGYGLTASTGQDASRSTRWAVLPISSLPMRLEHYRQAYAGIAGEQADQADVDRVFGVSATGKRLPKGFSPETLRLVEDRLRAEPADVSAAELAAGLGISRVSARRYLEHLVESGRAEVALRYGEVGSPERRYVTR
jgi:response regulator of citrate/malate metabolism